MENLSVYLWPPVAWRWLQVCTLSLLVGNLAAIGTDAFAEFQRWTGFYTITGAFAVGTILFAMSGTVAGILTGSVLQSMLPSLPIRTWTILHTGLGAYYGIVAEVLNYSWPFDINFMISSPLSSVIFGVVWGSVLAIFEALVLRTAATGAIAWVVTTAIAYAIATVVQNKLLGWVATLFVPAQWLQQSLLRESSYFAGGMVLSILMLPAIARLKWRNPM